MEEHRLRDELSRVMFDVQFPRSGSPDESCATELMHRYAFLIYDAMGGAKQVWAELKPGTATRTPHGVCVRPTEAGRLIHTDKERTRTFIEGLWSAVLAVSKRKPGKRVEVLYVGSGPFASLALPVASHSGTFFNVAFHTVDIHRSSLNFMDRVVSTFGLEEAFHTRICADAGTLRLEDHLSVVPDIVIAECMNRALLTEPQAGIMLNLLPQLPKDVIVIPERIEVKLGFTRQGDCGQVPVPFFDLSKEGVSVQAGDFDPASFTVAGSFAIPEREPGRPWTPHLETAIQVFEARRLEAGSCTITGSHLLPQLPDAALQKLLLKYRLGALPKEIVGLTTSSL